MDSKTDTIIDAYQKGWISRKYLMSWLNENTEEPYVPKKHKAWESAYDSKSMRGTSLSQKASAPPSVLTLPDGKWVEVKMPADIEDVDTFQSELKDWIAQYKPKCQVISASSAGKVVQVYLFKKQKDALLFKLTWG